MERSMVTRDIDAIAAKCAGATVLTAPPIRRRKSASAPATVSLYRG